MRILYVEDDESARVLLSKRLASVGIEVVCAESGQAGIELLRKEPFDALILDIMMPGIDGFQVGRTARKEGLNPKIPIIFLTAHPRALQESQAKALQPAASIAKPFKMEKILAALKELAPSRKS
jgi:two-component system phosphate regulon response regulator PhoB